MARLQEFLPTIRAVGVIKFIKSLWLEISKDKLTTQAAAVAYAWLFAVFPFLLFLITLFAYIPESKKINAEDAIASTLHKVMAAEAADTVMTNLKEVLHQPRSGLLSIGLGVTLWIASGGMSMTMTALDAAFDAKKTYPFYLQRPLAMVLTVIVTVLIIAVFVLLPLGSAIEHYVTSVRYIPSRVLLLLAVIRYAIAIVVMLTILAVLYTFGTRVRHRFAFFSPGAIFTILVWIILGESFRFYVDKFGRYEKTYGAVGGVTILLLFFYLDALVLLIGAEINSLVDRTMKERTME